MTEWLARPVLHVSSVEALLRFYVDRLGFTVPWRVSVAKTGCGGGYVPLATRVGGRGMISQQNRADVPREERKWYG